MANGTAERDAALVMLQKLSGTRPVTVGGDKGFDTFGFVEECRNLRVTPHVAQTWDDVAAARFMAASRGTLVRPQPEEEEAHRRMLWLAEDDCLVAEGSTSRSVDTALGLHQQRDSKLVCSNM
jgi:hypothetical protein